MAEAAAAAVAAAQMIADTTVIYKKSIFVPDAHIGRVLGERRRVINEIRAATDAHIVVQGLFEQRGFKTLNVTGCRNQHNLVEHLVQILTPMALTEAGALEALGAQVQGTPWRHNLAVHLHEHMPLTAQFCSELPEIQVHSDLQYEGAVYLLKASNYNKKVLFAAPNWYVMACNESPLQFPGRRDVLGRLYAQ